MSKPMRNFNNKNQKKFNNGGRNGEVKEKFKPLTIRKRFFTFDIDKCGNVYMDEALKDLFEICPDIKQFFVEEEIGLSINDLTAEDCKNILINLYTTNVPEMRIGGNNSFWAIQVSSNRCIIKTDKGFQFGWTLKFNKNRTQYDSIDLVYTAFSPKCCPSDELITEGGWIKDTY